MSSATSSPKARSTTCATTDRHYDDQVARENAAEKIQKTYRGHRTRRELQGLGLNASTRWTEAIKDAQYNNLTTPIAPSNTQRSDQSEPPDNSANGDTSPAARKNWQRIGIVARRAGGDDPSTSGSTSSGSDDTTSSGHDNNSVSAEGLQKRREERVKSRNANHKTAKMMDLQYFLEMVDHKHRYGSNLRKYHNYWKSQPTSQNFFYWLDHGEGKDVELPKCDRARLDREQVRYLSREERLNYLVTVDEQGRLRWAKNGERVWTRDAAYKDSMKGIVPIGDQAPEFHYNVPPEGLDSASISSNSEEEQCDKDDADKSHVNEDHHNAKGQAKLKEVSPATIFNHLLRGHLKKANKWIFVADTSFRLYIGIKQSGAFQHSSFLHGARVSAAGLIKIKDGQLRTLEPRSGHYRPPAANFRSFIHSLQDAGVDMSRISIPKSYVVLVGTDSYMRTKRKMKGIENSLEHKKDKVLHPERVKQQDEQQKDKSESAEKERQHLEKLRLEDEKKEQDREDKSLSARLARKLEIRAKED